MLNLSNCKYTVKSFKITETPKTVICPKSVLCGWTILRVISSHRYKKTSNNILCIFYQMLLIVPKYSSYIIAPTTIIERNINMPDGNLDSDKEYVGKERDFLYARALDIHKWSDYSEINNFVNTIYSECFLSANKIKKKHLKVVLLDLYVAWFQDPKFHLAIHLSKLAYNNGKVSFKGNSRYNETHIKPIIIDIAHKLVEVDLIEFKNGFGRPDQPSYTTRIWASSKLIRLFEDAQFGIFHIHYFGKDKRREYLILRDENNNNIEYTDKPSITKMRNVLIDYNALLEKTFIDIPTLEKPYISLPPAKEWTRTAVGEWKENVPTKLSISYDGKFTSRVFNNISWKDGGRFYGGFWQQVGSKYQSQIFINNKGTVEVDYSTLRVIFAYSKKNIDYWSKTDEDPYQIPIHGISNPEICTSIAKLLLLTAFNAPTEVKAFTAFRNEWNYNEFRYNFSDGKLSEILKTIRNRHPDISDLICTGTGVHLQYIDTQILEYAIKDFVATHTPILCVRDSLIVQLGQKDRLEKLLKQAFFKVTNFENIQIKFNKKLVEKAWKFSRYFDRGYYLNILTRFKKPKVANGYIRRMERHNGYFNPK